MMTEFSFLVEQSLLPWHSLFVHVLAYVQYLSDFGIIRSNYSNLFPVHLFFIS